MSGAASASKNTPQGVYTPKSVEHQYRYYYYYYYYNKYYIYIRRKVPLPTQKTCALSCTFKNLSRSISIVKKVEQTEHIEQNQNTAPA
jgi:hypothetical protein